MIGQPGQYGVGSECRAQISGGQHLGWLTGSNQTVIDTYNVGSVCRNRSKIVAYHYLRKVAFFAEFIQQSAAEFIALKIHPGCRFIKHQDLWLL